MATRFYLPSGGNSPLPTLAVHTLWDSSEGQWLRWGTAITKAQNTPLIDFAATFPTTATQYMFFAQWVSEPINAHDFTTAETWAFVVRNVEGDAAVDATTGMVIRVVSGDGSTVRGTLYGSNTGGEFVVGTPTTCKAEGPMAANVSAQTGDRIVIELGARGLTPSIAYEATMRFGDPATTADFALTSGLTTDLCPWVELSPTLTFVSVSDSVTGSGGVHAGASLAGSGSSQEIYVSHIENLLPGTRYHLRAYLTNPSGTDYGDEAEFTTTPAPIAGTGTVAASASPSGAGSYTPPPTGPPERAMTLLWTNSYLSEILGDLAAIKASHIDIVFSYLMSQVVGPNRPTPASDAEMLAYLDALDAAGLKAMLEVFSYGKYVVAGRDNKVLSSGELAALAAYVDKWKTHPAVWGWYADDEGGVEYPIATRQQVYDAIKDLHPAGQVLEVHNWLVPGAYSPAVHDLFALDIYAYFYDDDPRGCISAATGLVTNSTKETAALAGFKANLDSRKAILDAAGETNYFVCMQAFGHGLDMVGPVFAMPPAVGISKLWTQVQAAGCDLYGAGWFLWKSNDASTMPGGVGEQLVGVGVGAAADSANIIPAMTSATAPSGVASASSETYGEGWGAFDRTANTWHTGPVGGVGWLQYQFPEAHIFTQYAITAGNDPTWFVAPKSWAFQGSNNGSTWVTLDTQTDIADWAASPNARKVFSFVNTTAYAYGRLDISASNHANYVSIVELEMMEGGAYSAQRAEISAIADVVAGYDPPADALTVKTHTMTISGNGTIGATVTGGGRVNSDGGQVVTARGVCWNTTGAPTTADPKTTEAGTTGGYASVLTGLSPDTTYHVRAYVTAGAVTSYGAEIDVSYLGPIKPTPSLPAYSILIGAAGTEPSEDITDLVDLDTLHRSMSERGEASATIDIPVASENEVPCNYFARDAVVDIVVDGEREWLGHVVAVHKPKPQDLSYVFDCAGGWDTLHHCAPYCKGFVETRYDGIQEYSPSSMASMWGWPLNADMALSTDGEVLFVLPASSVSPKAGGRSGYLHILGGMDPSACIKRVTFDWNVGCRNGDIWCGVTAIPSPWDLTNYSEVFLRGTNGSGSVDWTPGDGILRQALWFWAWQNTTPSSAEADSTFQIRHLHVDVDRATAPRVDEIVAAIDSEVRPGAPGASTEAIGSPLAAFMLDPWTTPADGIATALAQAAVPPLCGIIQNQLIIGNRPTAPGNATRLWTVSEHLTPGLEWGVEFDEEQSVDYVGVAYNIIGWWGAPDGTPWINYYPSPPPNAAARTALIDGGDLTVAEALAAAEQAYHYLHDLASGPVTIPYVVQDANGNERPADVIRAWDWVQNVGSLDAATAGPFLISEVEHQGHIATLTIGAAEAYAYNGPDRLPTKGRYVGAHRVRSRTKQRVSFAKYWAWKHRKDKRKPGMPKKHAKYGTIRGYKWTDVEGRYV